MKLFEYNQDTGLPQFDPIVYELKPFKKLITRDKTKNKVVSKAEIAFIWFYADHKSDFSSELNDEVKVKEILNVIELPVKWKLDKPVKDAISFYKDLTTTTSSILLEQTKKTIKKLSEFMENIDFNDEDNSGKPKYDMIKVVNTTNQIPKLIATLREIEQKVLEEQEEIEKQIRGDKELAVWEDGDITED